MDPLNNITQLVVRTLFDIAIILMLLRLLLQLFRTDFYNPLSQSVISVTRFLDPLRKIMGARGGIDFATLLALFALQVGQFAVLSSLAGVGVPDMVFLLAISGITLLDTLATFFYYAIIASVVISWIAPGGQSPFTQLLWSLTEPILAPARRLVPPMGGLDFSPILVFLALTILKTYGIPALGGLVRQALL